MTRLSHPQSLLNAARTLTNKKGILSLICGICFRHNFDWDVIRL